MGLKSLSAVSAGICGAFLSPASALAQQQGGRYDYWSPHMMWGGGFIGGWFMIIFWILVIVAIFLGIKWAVNSGGSQGGARKESALDVLKRRYASGEIDRDQFLAMKKDLEN